MVAELRELDPRVVGDLAELIPTKVAGVAEVPVEGLLATFRLPRSAVIPATSAKRCHRVSGGAPACGTVIKVK